MSSLFPQNAIFPSSDSQSLDDLESAMRIWLATALNGYVIGIGQHMSFQDLRFTCQFPGSTQIVIEKWVLRSP